MERSETATDARLRERRELIAARAAEHAGRVVDTAGDGLLLEFASAAFAVRFAVAVQREMRARNRRLHADRRIEFRMGINVGDVIVDGPRIAGNGVNVAARLEALAEPGGICLSAAVREQLHDDVEIDCVDIGEQRVKNLERSVRVFRVAMHGKPRKPAPMSVGGPPATTSPRDDHIASIAVLPFANLSADAANEYFADGLAEELLNGLANIPGLRVVSRTSSFYFKGKSADLATIAAKLNVATVLEGSVRASDKRIRVAVQLIHVPSDSHLWSRTYDGALDDVLAMQDEIASSVVRELRPGLYGRGLMGDADGSVAIAQRVKGRTHNAEALRLYLQGRYFAARQTHADTTRALEHYERALAIDPAFALAWAATASAHAAHAGYGGDAPVAEGFRRARAAAQRALGLEPDLAKAHAVLAWIQLYCDWDWKSAEQSARRALELAPNDAGVLLTAASVIGNLGHDAETAALIRRAAQLDPLNAQVHRQVAMVELDEWHLDAADAAMMRALECDADLGLAHFTLGSIRMAQRRWSQALSAFERETLHDFRLLGVAVARHAQDRAAECAGALRELVERYGSTSPCQVATAYASMGQADAAFDWLDRALAVRDPRLVEVRGEPAFRALRANPRWTRLLEKMGLES